MSVQSTLAPSGLRLGVLGSLATLAFAAPLSNGDYSTLAHTSAERVGYYYSRTIGQVGIATVVRGVEVFRVDERGIFATRGTSIDNTMLGPSAGNQSLTAVRFTALGSAAGTDVTAATDTTLVGAGAGITLLGGINNTWVGSKAGTISFAADHTTTNNCIFLGLLAGDTSVNGATGLLVAGSTSAPLSAGFLGRGERFAGTLTGVTFTLNASGVQGTDLAAMGFTIAGGRSTGTGNGGDVSLAVAVPGTAGTTLNAIGTRVWVRGLNGSTVIGLNPTADAAGFDVQTGLANAIGVTTGLSLTLGKTQTWMGFRSTQAGDETMTLPAIATVQTSLSGKNYQFYARATTAATAARANRIVATDGTDIMSVNGFYTKAYNHRPWQKLEVQAQDSAASSYIGWATDISATADQFCSHTENFERAVSGSGYTTAASGGGAAVDQTFTGITDVFGAIHLTTGNTASGSARCGLNTVPLFIPTGVLNGYRFRFTTRNYIYRLSTPTHTFTLRTGLRVASVTATGDGDGCYFRYTDTVFGGNWQCITRNGGVETSSDSGVAVAATTFRELRIEINNDPALTTMNVRFYVSESLVATHTTNIPAAGSALGPFVDVEKSNGAGPPNAGELLVDYFTLWGFAIGGSI